MMIEDIKAKYQNEIGKMKFPGRKIHYPLGVTLE